MDIFRFADKIGKRLIIRRRPDSDRQMRFMCEFEDAEVRKSPKSVILLKYYGEGVTANEAISKYVELIRGGCLVFTLDTLDGLGVRTKLKVPKNLKTAKL